jgi:uncharacterized protein (TIGR03437 family)
MRIRTVRLLIVGIALAADVPAQQNLSFARKEIPVGPGCCSIVTADFNGDGKPDLAVTFSDSIQNVFPGNRILVLLGNGDGTFTPKPVIAGAGQSLGLVAAVDVNGDKKIDLLASSDAGTILLLGNGDGTFQPPAVITSDRLIGVSDFNGDGKPDLLSSYLRVRLGKGDGTFGSAIDTPGTMTGLSSAVLSFITSVAIADFNGDGRSDVALTSALHNQQGTVYTWLSNGDGTFTEAPLNIDFVAGFRAGPLIAVDFNGDGKADLAVAANQPDQLDSLIAGILLGRGDGTFRPAGHAALHGDSFAAGDFNGDGKIDLAAGPSVLPGDGSGGLLPQLFFGYGQASIVSSLAGYPLQAFYPGTAVADFNRDGKLDLVTVSRYTGFLAMAPDGLPIYVSTGLSILLNDSPGIDTSVVAVSAASSRIDVAPGSLASIYGSRLAATTATATASDLPDILGNISVHLRDAFGVDRLVRLLYVSPGQINFLAPADAAAGFATVNIENGSASFVEGTRATLVQTVAPAFFTSDGSGSGVPAATAVRVNPDGTQTPVSVFNCSGSTCTAVPIDLSGAPVYLSLYGTGFRNVFRTLDGSPSVGCEVQGLAAISTYVGPQGQFPGLDQINLRLPNLSGVGNIDLVCAFEDWGVGFANANVVRINIK